MLSNSGSLVKLSPFHTNILENPLNPDPEYDTQEITFLQKFTHGPLVLFELHEETRDRDAVRLLIYKHKNLL